MAQIVKGCPTPARAKRLGTAGSELRAGVGQASREETAGHTAVAELMLSSYGDLSVGSRAVDGDAGDEPISSVDSAIDIGGKALRRERSQRALDSVMVQRGQSHAGSPVVNEARLVEWMEECTHERCGGCGGARVMYAGTKVSTMNIGAPQRRHTKHGGVVVVSVCGLWGGTSLS